jgi:hypothetical protein
MSIIATGRRRNQRSYTTKPWYRQYRVIAIIAHYDAMLKIGDASGPRLSLPARSLRGRPASLRTVPDGARDLLRKWLIWCALLVVRRAISGVEPIFLPALRERGHDHGHQRALSGHPAAQNIILPAGPTGSTARAAPGPVDRRPMRLPDRGSRGPARGRRSAAGCAVPRAYPWRLERSARNCLAPL